jgi:hypothetical protein
VCKKNTSDLYWFGPKNALRPVREGGSCIILHRSACSRGYKRVREGGAPRSQDVSGVCMCVFASDESNGLSVRLLSPSEMVLALPFHRRKGNAGLHACAT